MPLSNNTPTTAEEPPRFSHDIDSACSTPFVSAPSSPGHAPSGYFFSAPASPTHYMLSNEKNLKTTFDPVFLSSDFEFSSRFSPGGRGSMISADELFFNGQIRATKLSSHLQRPQENVAPFADLSVQSGNGRGRGRDLRAKCSHRKARSMSPLLTAAEYEWQDARADRSKENESTETTPSCSASSSRSSSSSRRNSKEWILLKDLLHGSKSEGRAAHNNKERFWSTISIPFSPAKDKKKPPALDDKKATKCSYSGKPANGGVWKRLDPPSANRGEAEEMKKKTFLPYRQELLGCLGFSSKGYSAFSGFTRNLT